METKHQSNHPRCGQRGLTLIETAIVVAVTVLLGAATVACIVPMRRAIGVDPIRAIRSE